MLNARTRFWSMILLAAGVWLASLLFGGADTGLDEGIRRSIYANGTSLRPANLFAWLGNGLVLTAITIVAAFYLFFWRRIRAALLLIMVFGGRLLVELQKVVVNRDRPGLDEHLEAVYSMSFPSAHAANAMITFLALALLLPFGQRNRVISIGLALVLAGLVGWSRIALGVHWPTDVLGGWAFGILWIAICLRLASTRPEAEPTPSAG
jgi:undecaprenyl-diphosphatase